MKQDFFGAWWDAALGDALQHKLKTKQINSAEYVHKMAQACISRFHTSQGKAPPYLIHLAAELSSWGYGASLMLKI